MVAIAGLICFPFAIIARFLEIHWWVLAVGLGFVFLTLPVIAILAKKKNEITLNKRNENENIERSEKLRD